jgi:hypothetical protein
MNVSEAAHSPRRGSYIDVIFVQISRKIASLFYRTLTVQCSARVFFSLYTKNGVAVTNLSQYLTVP